MSEWTYLIFAGILEIGFASTMKLTENFTKLIPTIAFFNICGKQFLHVNKSD